MVMLEKYDQSIQALQLYMNITKLIPSEKEWKKNFYQVNLFNILVRVDLISCVEN